MENTAFNEAGHAVECWVLWVPIEEVSLGTKDGDDFDGRCRHRNRDGARYWEWIGEDAKIAVAGGVATALFNKCKPTVAYMRGGFAHEVSQNGWSDELLADLIAGVEADLRREWLRVAALAEALPQRRELSGQEATAVIDSATLHQEMKVEGGSGLATAPGNTHKASTEILLHKVGKIL